MATEPCTCSLYEAITGNLSEADVEAGNYETFTTGCAAETKRLFAPGHDAKLKSALIRWHMAGLEIRYQHEGLTVSSDAVTIAGKFAFGPMVVAGIAKAEEKAKARAARNAARKVSREEARKIGKAVADQVAAVKTPTLAEVVATEEAKHQQAEADKVRAQQAAADWDDEPECGHDRAKSDDTECPDCGADLAIVGADAEADEPTGAQNKYGIRVGRWEYDAVISENGTAWYTDKKGKQRMAKKGEYRFA